MATVGAQWAEYVQEKLEGNGNGKQGEDNFFKVFFSDANQKNERLCVVHWGWGGEVYFKDRKNSSMGVY